MEARSDIFYDKSLRRTERGKMKENAGRTSHSYIGWNIDNLEISAEIKDSN